MTGHDELTAGAAGPALGQVRSLSGEIARLTYERELAIARALAAGASWSGIGASLGCSAQAAHRKYRWICHNAATGEVWYEPPLLAKGPHRQSRPQSGYSIGGVQTAGG